MRLSQHSDNLCMRLNKLTRLKKQVKIFNCVVELLYSCSLYTVTWTQVFGQQEKRNNFVYWINISVQSYIYSLIIYEHKCEKYAYLVHIYYLCTNIKNKQWKRYLENWRKLLFGLSLTYSFLFLVYFSRFSEG